MLGCIVKVMVKVLRREAELPVLCCLRMVTLAGSGLENGQEQIRSRETK